MAGEKRGWWRLVALCVERVESVPLRLPYDIFGLLEAWAPGGGGDRLRVKPGSIRGLEDPAGLQVYFCTWLWWRWVSAWLLLRGSSCG